MFLSETETNIYVYHSRLNKILGCRQSIRFNFSFFMASPKIIVAIESSKRRDEVGKINIRFQAGDCSAIDGKGLKNPEARGRGQEQGQGALLQELRGLLSRTY